MPDKARCCQNCKAPCVGDFKKVVDLQLSGLTIYIHTTKDGQKKAGATNPSDTYILHNTGNKQISRPEYISELRQFKTKCVQCQSIVQRVRSLLDEIRAVKENEIIGVCNHCRRVNTNKTCKRCDFIVSKFMSFQQKKCEEKQERLKVWLTKVKHLLQSILEGDSVCQHIVHKDSELERFLQQLKEPLSMRQLDIDLFPSLDSELMTSQQSLSEGERMLDELLSNVKFEGKLSSDDSLYPTPSKTLCLCKYLKEKQFEQSSGFGTEKSKLTKTSDLLSDQVTLGEKSRDVSQLSLDEIEKELKKRLLNFAKYLPKVKYLNENLILELIETIHTAIRQGLPKDMIKKLINELNELHKLLSPHFADDINKEIVQKLINDLSKLITVESSKNINQMLIQLLIHLSELLPSELVKSQSKLGTQGSIKDDTDKKQTLPKSKEVKYQEDEHTPKSGSKEKKPGLLKRDTNKGNLQAFTKETVNQAHKDKKPGSSTVTSKDTPKTTNDLIKKIGNLNKALAGKSLNKDAIQDLSHDITKILSKKSSDLNKTMIQDLTDLCEPVVQGIPQTANKEVLQNLIKDASYTLVKGISNEQDKKTAEAALSKLKKAIKQSKKEPKHLVDIKPDNGKRKKVSENDSLDKSWSEGDIEEKETKTKKKGFKKKSETISDEGKENQKLLPSDKKKKIEKKSGTDLLPSKPIKPRELSGTVLLKMLQDNKQRGAKYKLFQERQQAKQKELERKRLKELALKGLKRSKKVVTPPPQPISLPLTSSVIECNIEQTQVPQLMVSGDTIEPYKPCSKEVEDPVQPLIFKTKLEFTAGPVVKSKAKQIMLFEDTFNDATIRYQLSDREFITKGWTKLPTEKVMRKMNIYKMEPANPNNDWFVRHKHEKELFYESGKKLADIDKDGRGRWYYQNGAIALNYYNAEESNIGQRYVVYSSGEEYECGKLKPRTVLALFDVLGNGVVYDHGGNVRLKFNQSEGVVVDPKLGPPGKWKWHTLNDPPVLQQVFVNTLLKEKDPRLERVDVSTVKTTEKGNFVKASHPEMLAIEFDNFIKEKATKLMQKFKPFQIRMKAIKLNKQFSLKILDQANIYLLFRDGLTNLKLNLGLVLISNEIIDTDTSDLSEVATPYDKYPAKTHSVENIQKILKSVRSGKVFRPIERDSRISI